MNLGCDWGIDQNEYQYSVSMQVYSTHHWCHVTDPYRAENVCNIFKIKNVVMLYKTAPDRARFFFYAKDLYHDSYSEEFEFP